MQGADVSTDSSLELCHLTLGSNVDKASDHAEEVAFPQPVRLRTVEVGHGKLHGQPAQGQVYIFAEDLQTLAGARFAQIGAGAVPVPAAALHAVPAEGLVTRRLVVRGHFQTLVLRVTGALVQGAIPELHGALGPLPELPDPAAPNPLPPLQRPPLTAGLSDAHRPPPPLLQCSHAALPLEAHPPPMRAALAAVLAFWRQVGMSVGERLPANLALYVTVDTFGPVLAQAELLLDVLNWRSGVATRPVTQLQAIMQELKGEARSAAEPTTDKAADLETVARVAVAWSGMLSGRATSMIRTQEVGIVGLAAAVVLCATRRGAALFLANGGLHRIAQVLFEYQRVPRTGVVRLCVTVLELVTLALGPLGCQAILGWCEPRPGDALPTGAPDWEPPEVPEPLGGALPAPPRPGPAAGDGAGLPAPPAGGADAGGASGGAAADGTAAEPADGAVAAPKADAADAALDAIFTEHDGASDSEGHGGAPSDWDMRMSGDEYDEDDAAAFAERAGNVDDWHVAGERGDNADGEEAHGCAAGRHGSGDDAHVGGRDGDTVEGAAPRGDDADGRSGDGGAPPTEETEGQPGRRTSTSQDADTAAARECDAAEERTADLRCRGDDADGAACDGSSDRQHGDSAAPSDEAAAAPGDAPQRKRTRIAFPDPPRGDSAGVDDAAEAGAGDEGASPRVKRQRWSPGGAPPDEGGPEGGLPSPPRHDSQERDEPPRRSRSQSELPDRPVRAPVREPPRVTRMTNNPVLVTPAAPSGLPPCAELLRAAMTAQQQSAVTASAARVIARLRAYEAMTAFSADLNKLIQDAERAQLDYGTMMDELASLQRQLTAVAAGLAAVDAPASDALQYKEQSAVLSSLLLPGGAGDGCILECLAERSVFLRAAQALHLPALIVHVMVEAGANFLGEQRKLMRLQCLWPIVTGLQELVAALAASPGGLALLQHERDGVARVVDAFGDVGGGRSPGAAAGLARTLTSVLSVADGVCAAVAAPPGTPLATAAVTALLHAAADAEEAPVLAATLAAAPGALPWLEGLLRACVALESGAARPAAADDVPGEAPPPASGPPPLEALHAPALLHALVSHCHADLAALWLPAADRLLDALQRHPALAEPPQTTARPPRRLRLLRDARGRLLAAATCKAQGCEVLLRRLDALLPALEKGVANAMEGGGRDWASPHAACSTSSPECAALVASHTLQGEVKGAADLLRELLMQDHGTVIALKLYGFDGLEVLGRLVAVAIALCNAARASTQRALLTGDAQDDAARAGLGDDARELLVAGCRAFAALVRVSLRLRHFRRAAQDIAVYLQGQWAAAGHLLLAAYHAVCWQGDALAACAKPHGHFHAVLTARRDLAVAVQDWLESHRTPRMPEMIFRSGMKLAPPALEQLPDGQGLTAAEAEEATASLPAKLSPPAAFTVLCLLGDIFPGEWPPPRTPEARGPRLDPPPLFTLRGTLALSLDPLMLELTVLVGMCCVSASQMVQAALVRMLARAAGCGGGMGTLVMTPIVNELSAAADAKPLPLARIHGLLLVTVPLLRRPAIKAVFLDARAASVLAKLLHSLASLWSAGDRGDLPQQATFQVLCHMVLDALTALCAPDCTLTPDVPPAERLQQDLPAHEDVGQMVFILVSVLPFLSVAAPAAVTLLRLLSDSAEPLVRKAFLLGVKKRHAQMVAQAAAAGQPPPPPAAATADILVVVADLIVRDAKMLASDDDVGAACVDACQDAAQLLKKMAGQQELEPANVVVLDRISAPDRFGLAVQAAFEAARKRGGSATASADDDARAALANQAPAALVHDAASAAYYAYAARRALPPAGAAARGRLVRHASHAFAEAARAAAAPGGARPRPCDLFATPLVPPRRPHGVQGAAVGGAVEMKEDEATATARAAASDDLELQLSDNQAPELPPIVARKQAKFSRPNASKHVDDFGPATPARPPGRPSQQQQQQHPPLPLDRGSSVSSLYADLELGTPQSTAAMRLAQQHPHTAPRSQPTPGPPRKNGSMPSLELKLPPPRMQSAPSSSDRLRPAATPALPPNPLSTTSPAPPQHPEGALLPLPAAPPPLPPRTTSAIGGFVGAGNSAVPGAEPSSSAPRGGSFPPRPPAAAALHDDDDEMEALYGRADAPTGSAQAQWGGDSAATRSSSAQPHGLSALAVMREASMPPPSARLGSGTLGTPGGAPPPPLLEASQETGAFIRRPAAGGAAAGLAAEPLLATRRPAAPGASGGAHADVNGAHMAARRVGPPPAAPGPTGSLNREALTEFMKDPAKVKALLSNPLWREKFAKQLVAIKSRGGGGGAGGGGR